MVKIGLLLMCFGGMVEANQVLGSYTNSYGNRTETIHITQAEGNAAQGWMVQISKNNDGSTIQWYSRVELKVSEYGQLDLVINYTQGEKLHENGSMETWKMEQERIERGRVMDNGNLKILPDVWRKTANEAKPTPQGKNLS